VETTAWVHSHQFRSIIVVTARYHMPRAMREFASVMPDVTLLSYPVDQDNIDLSGWWRHPQTVLLLHREFAKYMASVAVTTLGVK
jgi:uncharacterized SAM-binding protein YcdF (DUF218 family)